MKSHCQSFWLFGSSLFWLAITSPLQAQIVQDVSLPNPSIVTENGNTSVITGGTQAGSNLFHSFEQFSIPTNGSTHFDNAANIQNIISRVTGTFESKIDGSIRANGSANLFLLNPNGIIFGPNARLIIGGSFIGSTASSLKFADGTSFGTRNSQPTEPLLTVSVPLGLQFGRPAQSIQVQGARLEVPKTLGLVGGDLKVVGGVRGRIAAGGRIELGSVAESVTPDLAPVQVSLTPIDNGWALGYEGVQNFQDIQLSGQARAIAIGGSGGGDIQVQGRRVTLTGGSQMTANMGSNSGGTLAVTASESVEISGSSPDGLNSGLFARVNPGATGAGGNLTIETRQLAVRDGAQVSTATSGSGNAGNLTVRAADLVEVSGTYEQKVRSSLRATVEKGAIGDGGNLTIETGRLIVRDGAQVLTSTFGQGQAGNLTVQNATQVELVGGTVATNGEFFPSGLYASAEGATGVGGNLTISTEKLIVRDGAQVSAITLGAGRAGNLTVRATDVELVGVAISADGQVLINNIGLPFASGLFAGTDIGSQGDGGTLSVETDRLSLWDGAVVQASTLGEGNAGNLTVQAKDSVELIGTAKGSQYPTSLLAVSGGIPRLGGVLDAKGKGGNLEIKTGELIVRDGAAVAVASLNPTNDAKGAGNLQVQAQSIRLDNQGELTAATASGQGGNITLSVQDLLLLRRNSNISTTAGIAGAGGNGGNITIDTPFIVAFPLEDSNITANAFTGNGGNVQITTQSIFGIQFREDETPLLSDITASSKYGLDGVVEINTPEVDPRRGLVNLPAELVDVSGLIASGCGAFGRQEQSTFIVAGRGGLPPSPSDPLSSDTVWSDLRVPTQFAENLPSAGKATQPTNATAGQLVEAQGWVINNKGEVVLTATAPNVTSHIPCRTGERGSGRGAKGKSEL